MLVLHAIDKSYNTARAVGGVTLEVAVGEGVLLVGRNGAGKTTLLRIATGFLDPDAGTVTIDGIPMDRARARAQAKLGYLPEHAPAPPELTVRDHLRLRARLKGIRQPAAVDRVLAATSIEDKAGAMIGTLSKGFRQRVGLADALLGEPPLLVLDEPTSGMDPIQTKQLCDHLVEVAATRAVLVSSHAVTDLERFASRVAILRRGELVADATPAALCAGIRDPYRTGPVRLDVAVIALLDDGDPVPLAKATS